MLGVTHPYDLHGHVPAHRWGTTHQLVARRFNDPIEAAENRDEERVALFKRESARPASAAAHRDPAPTSRTSPSGIRAVRGETGSPSPRYASPICDVLASAKSIRSTPMPTKQSLRADDAARHGMSVTELLTIRRAIAAAEYGTKGLSKPEREARVADALNWAPDRVSLFRRVESELHPQGAPKVVRSRQSSVDGTIPRRATGGAAQTMSATATGKHAPQPEARRSGAVKVTSARPKWRNKSAGRSYFRASSPVSGLCPSCGVRPDITGHCRCSR